MHCCCRSSIRRPLRGARAMLIPQRLMLWLLAAWLATGIAVAFLPGALQLWQITGAIIAAALGADALAAWRARSRPTIRRSVPQSLAVGEWHSVRLRLWNGGSALQGWIQDNHPASFEAAPLPQKFLLRRGLWTDVVYRVRPLARGDHQFGALTLRIDSPLRLWQRSLTCGAST